jgi:hypothetical protein
MPGFGKQVLLIARKCRLCHRSIEPPCCTGIAWVSYPRSLQGWCENVSRSSPGVLEPRTNLSRRAQLLGFRQSAGLRFTTERVYYKHASLRFITTQSMLRNAFHAISVADALSDAPAPGQLQKFPFVARRCMGSMQRSPARCAVERGSPRGCPGSAKSIVEKSEL